MRKDLCNCGKWAKHPNGSVQWYCIIENKWILNQDSDFTLHKEEIEQKDKEHDRTRDEKSNR